MSDQSYMTDMFPMWQEWNRASMNLWGRMVQGWTDPATSTDVVAGWQEWNRTNQQMWNQMLQNWIESDDFAKLVGKSMEGYLTAYGTFNKTAQQYAEQLLHSMNLATLDDINRIAEMLVNLENKIDALADELDRGASK